MLLFRNPRLTLFQHMMVVVKDALDRIKANERMGVEASAAVESDITALLQGKSYDHLVALQKQIQAKLVSGEPIDVDYWEGLLKKLIVWKAKVRSFILSNNMFVVTFPFRQNLRLCTKLWFGTALSNFVNGREMRLCKLKRNCWLALPSLQRRARNGLL